MQTPFINEAKQQSKENLEYMMKLEESYKQLEEGKVIIKTIEELEAMENEK